MNFHLYVYQLFCIVVIVYNNIYFSFMSLKIGWGSVDLG